jgi:hypothetical protein
MNAIRKVIETERNEVTITVNVPDDFKSRKLEVIILPLNDDVEDKNEFNLDEYHQSIRDYWADLRADLTNYKFNRDELYER